MTAQPAHSATHTEAHGEAHAQPHNAPYILIWGILLVLTLAEVGYAFLSLPKVFLALGLIIMAFWKAILVALYYMHLRWEPRRLWVLAVAPLPLIAILILAVLMEY
jgi:cytochrome c oxidase subunit IV